MEEPEDLRRVTELWHPFPPICGSRFEATSRADTRHLTQAPSCVTVLVL
jgi:hypothetical protein